MHATTKPGWCRRAGAEQRNPVPLGGHGDTGQSRLSCFFVL